MQLLGLNIFKGKYYDFFECIKNPTQKTLIFTPNPEILVRAYSDAEFLTALKKATYNTPDANGLYVGAMMQDGLNFFRAGITTFFQKTSIQEKYGELIKGSDLTKDIFQLAGQTKQKILIIDSYRIMAPKNQFEVRKKQIQSNFDNLLREHFPNLSFILIFDGDQSSSEIATLIEQQDISYVFSCLGMKTQEIRLIEIFDVLPIEQKVVGLGVGASIDFLLGLQKRAPVLFQKLGLEWLYRLILEPRKRWKRIYTAVVEFPRLIKSLPKGTAPQLMEWK